MLTPLTYDNSVKLVKGGVIAGAERASTEAWPVAAAPMAYGSAADMHGLTITPAEVNAAGFGIAISAVNGGSAEIDYAELFVYYV